MMFWTQILQSSQPGELTVEPDHRTENAEALQAELFLPLLREHWQHWLFSLLCYFRNTFPLKWKKKKIILTMHTCTELRGKNIPKGFSTPWSLGVFVYPKEQKDCGILHFPGTLSDQRASAMVCMTLWHWSFMCYQDCFWFIADGFLDTAHCLPSLGGFVLQLCNFLGCFQTCFAFIPALLFPFRINTISCCK